MIALVLAGALAWSAPQIASLHADVDHMLASAKTLGGTHVGLLAVDTQTGRVLYARDADDAFMPASTLKVLTGSASLATLGPDFTFKTEVATLPALDPSVPAGAVRLVLVGGGDARLKASDLDAAAAAVAAADLGPIVEVDADTSLFDQERYGYGWTIDDIPNAYAPVLTALCLDDNVTGDTPLPDPAQYALATFEDDLRARGVDLSGVGASEIFTHPPSVAYHVVWMHQSKPLSRYLADFWYPSDNLVGEMLLKTLGVAHRGVPGTSENGAALEEDWLRSLGVNPARNTMIADGSGVSIYDRIAPRTLVKILQVDWKGPYRRIVLDALPQAGVRGTLRDDFKGTPAAYRTYAKDGVRMFGRGLAGYLRTRRQGMVTFAFLIDDWMGQDDDLQKLRARLLSRLITS